jgi:aspartyl-tRNA(Asn)/glutamyl-tRNA(Gln) amidotransferase subunit C
MRLTREDILHLADLSRLDLSEEELVRAEFDLASVLGYVERLSAVPTTDIVPAAAHKRETWRPDIAIPCAQEVREAVLRNFPARQGDLLKTPGVFANPKG